MGKKGGATRPRSAYNFFMQEKRKEVIEKNPNLKAPDVMKEVSKLWKAATPEEKEKFTKMSEEDHERVNQGKKDAPAAEKKSKSKKKKDDEEEDEDEEE